ncbi:hypothetical protein [Francisella salina]|uniref:Peptidase C58 YopT-type domain-containing protein n=1 Tax=Francisella salina TaxID=573569 RepID=A0ABM5MCH9_FRAST|nr:hypothetical protein [Francisella salina]AEI36816.1 hypothetical protein F7308_1892 [Francisella salina]
MKVCWLDDQFFAVRVTQQGKEHHERSGRCIGLVILMQRFLKHKKYIPNRSKWTNFIFNNTEFLDECADNQSLSKNTNVYKDLEDYIGEGYNNQKYIDRLLPLESITKSLNILKTSPNGTFIYFCFQAKKLLNKEIAPYLLQNMRKNEAKYDTFAHATCIFKLNNTIYVFDPNFGLFYLSKDEKAEKQLREMFDRYIDDGVSNWHNFSKFKMHNSEYNKHINVMNNNRQLPPKQLQYHQKEAQLHYIKSEKWYKRSNSHLFDNNYSAFLYVTDLQHNSLKTKKMVNYPFSYSNQTAEMTTQSYNFKKSTNRLF